MSSSYLNYCGMSILESKTRKQKQRSRVSLLISKVRQVVVESSWAISIGEKILECQPWRRMSGLFMVQQDHSWIPFLLHPRLQRFSCSQRKKKFSYDQPGEQ